MDRIWKRPPNIITRINTMGLRYNGNKLPYGAIRRYSNTSRQSYRMSSGPLCAGKVTKMHKQILHIMEMKMIRWMVDDSVRSRVDFGEKKILMHVFVGTFGGIFSWKMKTLWVGSITKDIHYLDLVLEGLQEQFK